MTAEPEVSDLPRGVVVVPPPPGVAILGCRCGRAIDSRDLNFRFGAYGGPGSVGAIPSITCPECARS